MPIDDYRLSDRSAGGPFERATRRRTFEPLQHSPSAIIEQRQLEKRFLAVRDQARTQYARHRELWILQEIGRLTAERHRPVGDRLVPPIIDRSTDPRVIERDAARRVEQRFQERMGRLNGIQERMEREVMERAHERGRRR